MTQFKPEILVAIVTTPEGKALKIYPFTLPAVVSRVRAGHYSRGLRLPYVRGQGCPCGRCRVVVPDDGLLKPPKNRFKAPRKRLRKSVRFEVLRVDVTHLVTLPVVAGAKLRYVCTRFAECRPPATGSCLALPLHRTLLSTAETPDPSLPRKHFLYPVSTLVSVRPCQSGPGLPRQVQI